MERVRVSELELKKQVADTWRETELELETDLERKLEKR